MKRSVVCFGILVTATALAVSPAVTHAGDKPNTIVILTGDTGAGNFPTSGSMTTCGSGASVLWRGGLSAACEADMRISADLKKRMMDSPNIKPERDSGGYR